MFGEITKVSDVRGQMTEDPSSPDGFAAASRGQRTDDREQRTAEPQNNPPEADRISKDGFALLSLFYKIDSIHSFDI